MDWEEYLKKKNQSSRQVQEECKGSNRKALKSPRSIMFV